jgi:hypothetical protein
LGASASITPPRPRNRSTAEIDGEEWEQERRSHDGREKSDSQQPTRNGRIGFKKRAHIGFPSISEAEEWDHRRGRQMGALPRSRPRNGSKNVGATMDGKKSTANNQQEME